MKNLSGGILLVSNLTAGFDSREGADLALMRLRRGGITFTVTDLTVDGAGRARHREPGMTNGIFVPSAFGGSFQPFGMNALLSGLNRKKGEAVLKLQVRSEQMGKAWEIIRSAGGREPGNG